MTTPGFEYKNKKNETPFETFLRYTNEKEQSAVKLATVLQKKLRNAASILDIGTGNGEYLKLVLLNTSSHIADKTKLTLLEPSSDLSAQLKNQFANLTPQASVEVVSSDLQAFDSDEKFDIILMSHLFYHLPRPAWSALLIKTLLLLKKDGVLIIVLRERDDAYSFKMAFKPLLFDSTFQAFTIDDVLAALPKDQVLHIDRQTASSELDIPIEKSLEDTISIIEFYLNKEWDDIPHNIQESSLDFIKKRNGIFKQLDGIALITVTD